MTQYYTIKFWAEQQGSEKFQAYMSQQCDEAIDVDYGLDYHEVGNFTAEEVAAILPHIAGTLIAVEEVELLCPRHPHAEDCPGCGFSPGDGLHPTCNHPNGCGHWRELEGEETRKMGTK